MGIYPDRTTTDHRRLPDGTETWTEVHSEPGLTRRRAVTAEQWVDERTDCFCCSCPDWGIDYACRNHGGDAQRPCELHNMPGSPDDDDRMPDSVQTARAKYGENR